MIKNISLDYWFAPFMLQHIILRKIIMQKQKEIIKFIKKIDSTEK